MERRPGRRPDSRRRHPRQESKLSMGAKTSPRRTVSHMPMNRFQAIDPKVLGLKPGDRLLDVGCGIGRHIVATSLVAALHIGVDSAREDLHKAAAWIHLLRTEEDVQGSVYFLQGDAAHLPLAEGSFDRVICTEVLEHVANDRAVLAELARVLRPGGVLAISVPDEPAERIIWGISPQYRNYPGGHVRVYSRRELSPLLKESGVRPFAVRFRHSLEALYWLFRILDSKNIAREGVLTSRLGRILGSISPELTPMLDRYDAVGNYILPKSIVVYARKQGHVRP
ncbi:MAG: class I SAM-dependent methyltransferase [Dehalococcoidia bacterium]